jgi:hypothetical protein
MRDGQLSEKYPRAKAAERMAGVAARTSAEVGRADMGRAQMLRRRRFPDDAPGGTIVLVALLIGTVLIVGTIVLHYEALRLISAMVSEWARSPRLCVLFVALGCFASHVLAIAIYAGGYVLIERAGLGALEGKLEHAAGDFLYFSAAAYSTVGFGDVYGTGAMRLISAFEAVNGLFLIAWSTSFTYLAMERLWPLHSRIQGSDEQD